HGLILDETAAIFSQGSTEQVTIETSPPGVTIPAPRAATATADSPLEVVYTSRVIETPFPFNDLVPSWNVELPEGTGFRVEIRMGRKAEDFWTPFYYFGVWGNAPRPETRVIETSQGVIDVDTFRSTQAFDRIQYRFLLTTSAAGKSPVIRRVGLAFSNTLGDEALAKQHRQPIDPGSPSGWARRLTVPWRSQKAEDPKIAGSICSPTSVSMVLQFYGVNVPTAEVAANVFDREYRIYGNWIRAVQTAYQYGVAGYLQRFGDFEAVKQHIAAGHPVIASIRVDEAGELRGAPYQKSNGHLIVIAGFDANGNLQVNDPAAKTIEAGVVTYAKEDMQKVWLDHGGVGYVLIGKPR
ncbi:MAG TPA: C39 family peptidase, partial [Phycisphaerae bacterium]|nr:C39 family peptidase [Phycisphaerae bacterium]